MNKVSTVGQAIRHYREQKRWTIGQLARYSDVTSSHISQVERGVSRGDFRRSTLQKLATALGVKVEDLTEFAPRTLAEPKATYSTEGTRRQRLYAQLNQLSDNQLEALERMLEVFLSGESRP